MTKLLFASLMMIGSMPAWGSEVILVSVFGTRAGPKVEDFEGINTKIGNLVADFQLRRFDILGYGIEGGYQACLIPNPDVPSAVIRDQMAAITVDPKQTMYSVTTQASCE